MTLFSIHVYAVLLQQQQKGKTREEMAQGMAFSFLHVADFPPGSINILHPPFMFSVAPYLLYLTLFSLFLWVGGILSLL